MAAGSAIGAGLFKDMCGPGQERAAGIAVVASLWPALRWPTSPVGCQAAPQLQRDSSSQAALPYRSSEEEMSSSRP